MRGECALKWVGLVCVCVAWWRGAAAAPAEDEALDALAMESPLRGSLLVPENDWLTEYIKLDRKPMFPTKEKLDCFAEDRRSTRPYPHDCYGHSSTFNEAEFLAFWQEVHGDLEYTFDFVLYNEFFNGGSQGQADTSFWILIAYLKHLAITIPDPNNIALGNLVDEKLNIFLKYKAELTDLNNQAQKKADELDALVKKL